VTTLRKFVENNSVIAELIFLLVDEAWVVTETDESRSRAMMESGESLEHHPERMEWLIFMAEDASEGAVMAHREIRRDDARPELGPLVFSEGGTMSGRMIGLLPTMGRAS